MQKVHHGCSRCNEVFRSVMTVEIYKFVSTPECGYFIRSGIEEWTTIPVDCEAYIYS